MDPVRLVGHGDRSARSAGTSSGTASGTLRRGGRTPAGLSAGSIASSGTASDPPQPRLYEKARRRVGHKRHPPSGFGDTRPALATAADVAAAVAAGGGFGCGWERGAGAQVGGGHLLHLRRFREARRGEDLSFHSLGQERGGRPERGSGLGWVSGSKKHLLFVMSPDVTCSFFFEGKLR